MSGKYRCYFCKHRGIEYDVLTAMGDQHVSERWVCCRRDDEVCIPGCDCFEQKDGKKVD